MRGTSIGVRRFAHWGWRADKWRVTATMHALGPAMGSTIATLARLLI